MHVIFDEIDKIAGYEASLLVGARCGRPNRQGSRYLSTSWQFMPGDHSEFWTPQHVE
jgi:hypothetical protein